MQSIFTVLKLFCALYIHPYLPTNLWQTLIFTVSIVLPFPEGHRVGIIQSIAFADWLLSLSNQPLRVLHVFSWLDFFLARNNIPLSCSIVLPLFLGQRLANYIYLGLFLGSLFCFIDLFVFFFFFTKTTHLDCCSSLE